MSKCHLTILLDHTDRIYRGGEKLRGQVRCAVNQDVACRGITIEASWRTHGRGNRARGAYFSQRLSGANLEAGQRFTFPFEVDLPHNPLTYRGTILNIDHYIKAQVDIPWAVDPKHEVDFVLLPAATKPVGLHATQIAKSESGAGAAIGMGVSISLLIFGLLFIPVFGIGFLIMAVGAAGLFFCLRKTLAERVIGEVNVDCGERITTSGRTLPVNVRFKPKSTGRITRISTRLIGREECVSGSGSDRRTHTHNLHNEIMICDGPNQIQKGEVVSYSAELAVPETLAYSFAATDNKVVWEVRTHIDIPNWPDWKSSDQITIVPSEHLNEPPRRNIVHAEPVPQPILAEEIPEDICPLDAPEKTIETTIANAEDSAKQQREDEIFEDALEAAGVSMDADEPADEPTGVAVANESQPSAAAIDQPSELRSEFEADDVAAEDVDQETHASDRDSSGDASQEVAAASSDAATPCPELMDLCGQLTAARKFSDDAKNLLSENLGKQFDLDLIVDRVSTTIGAYNLPEYRNGKTVRGMIFGTEQQVAIEMPDRLNDELNRLRSGDRWQASATAIKWDDLFQRLELRGVGNESNT